MDFVRIGEVAAGEAERQGCDFNGYVRLVQAYGWAREASWDIALPLHPNYVYMLANMIEPGKNALGAYRSTPVAFANGGYAVDADLVPEAMSQWFDIVNNPGDGLISCGPEFMRKTFVREFLRIHPFRDGNGRVAWILRTRFYDQWDSPVPLPKYFLGE
jgi:Fic family protein